MSVNYLPSHLLVPEPVCFILEDKGINGSAVIITQTRKISKCRKHLLLRNRNSIFDERVRNAALVTVYILVHFDFEINIYLIKIYVSEFEVIKLRSIRTL